MAGPGRPLRLARLPCPARAKDDEAQRGTGPAFSTSPRAGPTQGTKAAVAGALQAQIDRVAACLLQELPDSASAAALARAPGPPAGRGPMLGSLGRRPPGPPSEGGGGEGSADPLTPAEPHRSLGFRLEAAPSGIRHAAAGLGVWLRGVAPVGQVGPEELPPGSSSRPGQVGWHWSPRPFSPGPLAATPAALP